MTVQLVSVAAQEHNFCSLTLQLGLFSLEQTLPCHSPIQAALPASQRHPVLFMPCIFNSLWRIQCYCYTYFVWWSSFSTPSSTPSLQCKALFSFVVEVAHRPLVLCFPAFLNQSERIPTVPLSTPSDVWPEWLNGICKPLLTQGNRLLSSSFPLLLPETHPRVTVLFYLTHPQNIQSKDSPCFKELTMFAH